MTISTLYRNDYVGDDSTDTYSFTFDIFVSTDLKVIKSDSSGNETELTSGQYTVTITDPAPNSGSIVLTGGNLATGETLSIERNRPFSQTTDLQNQSSFFPATHEDAFDHSAMLARRAMSLAERAVHLREGANLSNFTMELPEPEASKPIGWNAAADALVNLDVNVVTPTSIDSVNTTFTNAGAGASERSVQAVLRDRIRAADFGVVADGVTDDAANLQAAIDAVGTAGGVVELPAGKILINSEIVVASHGVVLQGQGTGRAEAAAADNLTSIVIGANISGAMIRFAQVSSVAGKGCGIRDIAFDGDDRGFTCTAALHVEYGDLFSCQRVTITGVAGRGLYTQRCVRSSFHDMDIVECGDTSDPAVDVNEIDASDFTQGSYFTSIRIEVAFNAAYLNISANCKSNHFIGVGFETDSGQPTSEQKYIALAGDNNLFSSIHMNKNSGTDSRIDIVAGATLNSFSQVRSRGAHGGHVFDVAGQRNFFSHIIAQATAAASFYLFNYTGSATYNKVNGGMVQLMGAVKVGSSAHHNSFVDISSDDAPVMVVENDGDENLFQGITSDMAGDTSAMTDSIIKDTGDRTMITGCYLRDAVGATAGIEVTGSNYIISNNHVSGCDAASGIKISGPGGSCNGNFIFDVGLHGIHVDDTNPVAINSNTILQWDKANTGTYDGISLRATTNKNGGIIVGGNRIDPLSATANSSIFVTDNGGAPRFTNLTIVDNNCEGSPAMSIPANGSNWVDNNHLGKGSDIASATTITLGDHANYFDITGTTNIATITASWPGRVVTLMFDGSLTLQTSGNLKLDSAGTVAVTANDMIQFVSDGVNWHQLGTLLAK